MLEINLKEKSYKNEVILKDINYCFNDAGMYSILGESGVGKSTFLNILSLIDSNFIGEIRLENKSISSLNELDKRKIRLDNFSFVFQSFNLLENDTVLNNLLLTFDSLSTLNKDNKVHKIDQILTYLNIYDLKFNLVNNLSGGEKQRVAIARALITNPKVIFADEPTGSLDDKNQDEIFSLLRNLSKDILVIVVTHNKEQAYKYSDYVLKLKKDRIEEEKIENNEKEKVKILKEKHLNKAGRISLRFKISHFISLIKFKKKRYAAMFSFLSAMFFIIGFSSYISDSFSSVMVDSFGNLMGENSLILKRKNDDSSIISYLSASKEDVLTILDNEENVDYVGASYSNDFSSFFIDQNYVSLINNKNKEIELSSYKIENFIDFDYVSTFKNFENIYPSFSKKLKDGEVVISISNEDMLDLTKKLNIKENYESLGNYLIDNNFSIYISLKNYSWGYLDEQLLSLKAIVPGRENKVYSTNSFFNEYLIEECMRFPSTLSIQEESEDPWTLKKSYYFHTEESASSTINKLIKESTYYNYVFDHTSYDYNYFSSEEDENKIYCFKALKKSIDLNIVNNLSKNINFKKYYFSTDNGYVNYGSILTGFARPTFFSFHKNKIDSIIDLNSKITLDEFYSLSVEENVLEGNYLKQTSDIVRFSSLFNKEINGTYPESDDEIAISQGFIDLINIENPLNKIIYITTINKIVQSKDNLYPEFKTISLKVCGITSSNRVEIIHNNDFSLTLFRDLFKISSFELNVNNVTFLLNEMIPDSDIEYLNSLYDGYEFIAPLNEIEKSIDETLSTISYFLYLFSFVVIFASLILLSILNYLSFLESKKETAILILLGFSNEEILKEYFFNSLLINFISMIGSSIMIFLSYLLMPYVMKSIFGSLSSVFISFTPFLYMFLVIMILSFLSLVLIYFPLKKIDIKKELH